MVQGLSHDIGTLKTELSETRDSIKQYNGLREQLNYCQQELKEIHGRATGGKDAWGYIVGGIGLFIALISFAIK